MTRPGPEAPPLPRAGTRRRRPIAAALLALACTPAVARDDPALGAVRRCLATAGEPRSCIGAHAQPCMAAEGGASTVGMTACTAAETAAWDRLLNESYAALVIAAKRRAAGAVGAAPDHEGLLREAQRAWLAFRDADCAQEAAIWGEGSVRQIAGAYCVLDRTAARVLELGAKQAAMEPG